MNKLLPTIIGLGILLAACAGPAQINPVSFARGEKIVIDRYDTPFTYESVRVFAKRGQSGDLPFMELQIQNQTAEYIKLEIRPLFFDDRSGVIAIDAPESKSKFLVVPPRELKALKVFAPSDRVASVLAEIARIE